MKQNVIDSTIDITILDSDNIYFILSCMHKERRLLETSLNLRFFIFILFLSANLLCAIVVTSQIQLQLTLTIGLTILLLLAIVVKLTQLELKQVSSKLSKINHHSSKCLELETSFRCHILRLIGSIIPVTCCLIILAASMLAWFDVILASNIQIEVNKMPLKF
jgi:hypothetical protein